MQQIHPSQLAQATNAQGVVVIDFFTPTCGPCKQMPPMLAQVERATGAPTYKVDITQDGMQLATQLGIRSVPTVVIYSGGREVERSVGVPANAQHLVNRVQAHM